LLFVIAHEAAVDDIGATSDVCGFVGGEEGGEAGDFSGLPRRPSGMLRSRGSSSAGSAIIFELMGVAMAPGAMLLTVMPRGPSSTARSRMSMRIAPFEAQ
jgi:hypothetical protein